jgi:hypothetical protein
MAADVIFSLSAFGLPARLTSAGDIELFLPDIWDLSRGDFTKFVTAICESVVHESVHLQLRGDSEWEFNESGVMDVCRWLGFATVYERSRKKRYEHLHRYLVNKKGGDSSSIKFTAALLAAGPSKKEVEKLCRLPKQAVNKYWGNLVDAQVIKGGSIQMEDFTFAHIILVSLVAEGLIRAQRKQRS